MQQHPAIGPRLSVMMFIQFFVWGAWYVTVGNFIGSIGWGGGVIGWAYTVGPIAGIISPFFLGMVADRFFAAERVLGVLHLLGGLVMFAVPFTAVGESPQSTVFIALLLLHMLFYMPTLGLVNTLAFHNMTNQEKQFPVIRVFGTIGWIAANFVVSKIFQADKLPVQFYIAGISSILLGLYSFTLPHTPPQAAGKKVSIRDVLCLDALALLKDRSFFIFMVCSFLICIPLSAYYAFAPVFADKVGVEDVAFTMSFGQVSEIFFMLVMPLCFAFLGVKWMLGVGMLAWVVRYACFAAGASDDVMWLLLIGIVLHGICYDFFFVTGQIYVDKRAPSEIRGQAQGFLVLMTLGLGLLIGAQISGYIVEQKTPPEAVEKLTEANKIGGELFTLEKQLEGGAQPDPELQRQIAALTEAKGRLTGDANRMRDWRAIWMYPAIAAGVVLLVFLVLFKNPKNHGQVTESAESAGS